MECESLNRRTRSRASKKFGIANVMRFLSSYHLSFVYVCHFGFDSMLGIFSTVSLTQYNNPNCIALPSLSPCFCSLAQHFAVVSLFWFSIPISLEQTFSLALLFSMNLIYAHYSFTPLVTEDTVHSFSHWPTTRHAHDNVYSFRVYLRMCTVLSYATCYDYFKTSILPRTLNDI